MTVKGASVKPHPLSGRLKVMPSKSMSHRLAICAGLAGASRVRSLGLSEDIMATCNVLRGLGYKMDVSGDVLISGQRTSTACNGLLDCGESGSTLRFLIPLALDGTRRRFTGHGRLLSRPQAEYERIFAERGIDFIRTNDYIEVCGTLTPGVYRVRGDVSSQFISGLLFALPVLDGDSRIEISEPLESRSYIDLTLSSLAAFGVHADWDESHGIAINVPGKQKFQPSDVSVEGDFSHAAFWLAAGVLGNGVELTGLKHDSLQGDAHIIDILRAMGAKPEWHGDTLCVPHAQLHGTEVDVSQVPDLFPILSVLAAEAKGITHLTNAARLRIKESDRLAAMAKELSTLGASVTEEEDSLTVDGGHSLKGAPVSAHNDHRIAMSMAIAASVCSGEMTIDNAECVRKSAPDFWEEYRSLGGSFTFSGEN